MKTACVASFAFLFGLTGCDRTGAASGHGDAGGTAASSAAASPTTASATAPAPAPAGDPGGLAGFEGEMDLSVKSKTNPPFSLALLTKDDLIRFSLPGDVLAQKAVAKFTGGGNVYGVLKTRAKNLTIVLETQKKAIVIDLDQAGERLKALKERRPGASSASSAPSPPSAPPKITKTGRMETVAGVACEDWEVSNADRSKASLCVTNQPVSFFSIPLTSVPAEQAWALELVDGKHFPLRLVAFDPDGAESGRIEVTKFDRHPIDAATFEIPPSYSKMTLDDLIASMGGGAQPPGDVPHDGPRGHGRHHGHH